MSLSDNTPISQVSVGLAGGVVAIGTAIIFARSITSTRLPTKEDDPTDKAEREKLASESLEEGKSIGTADDFLRWFQRVEKLQTAINTGAQSFLMSEYKYLFFFCIIIFAALCGVLYTESAQTQGVFTGICFLVGALFSALAGYIGMLIATEANSRTAYKCAESMKAGLEVSFASGAVMANSVVGLGIIGVIVLYLIFSADTLAWQYLSGFGFGASAIALFARVGGGIFTKAADVGADLVGKVDSGIPEDDPRNPATIADNVGDNVGDVAGMGADLFESFVGGLIATATLAPTLSTTLSGTTYNTATLTNAGIALPFWVAGFGIIIALVGTAIVRNVPIADDAGLERLLAQINYGIFTSAGLVVVFAFIACGSLFGFDNADAYRLFGCIIIGLAAGLIIGQFTEFCTSYEKFPTRRISESSKFGTAPVIIMGLGVGMISVTVPTITLCAAVLSCNALAGLYGISLSSVGMLSTLGITLATDAYGPVADNAGGIAEMAGMHDSIRTKTDALDSLGNTTAATGKGFAIGSAVLTAVGLIAAFLQQSGVNQSTVSLANPVVLSGVLIGAMLPYVFAALTMLSVNKAAQAIIAEVRRQFSACPDLLRLSDDSEEIYLKHKGRDGLLYPNSDRCVAIATQSAVAEMLLPGVAAVFSPVIVGFLLGTLGLAGLLAGALTSGFMLALTMSNAGGAWDNAKKWVEKCAKESDETGRFTKYGIKKGSVFDSKFDASSSESIVRFSTVATSTEAAGVVSGYLTGDEGAYARGLVREELGELYHERHSAVVNGDTVGDPFKDTSGPALNILIKLMSVISLVLAPAFRSLNEHNGFGPTGWWVALVVAIVIGIVSALITSSINASNAKEEKSLTTMLDAQRFEQWTQEAKGRQAAVAAVDVEAAEDVIAEAVKAVKAAAIPALVKGATDGVSADKADATELLKLRDAVIDATVEAVQAKLGISVSEGDAKEIADAAKDKLRKGDDEEEEDGDDTAAESAASAAAADADTGAVDVGVSE